MAKTISDEVMKLTMVINGDSAQKEINDLEKATIKLKNTNSDLAFQRKLIKKQLGEESIEYKKLTNQINQNSLEIKQNEDKVIGLISNLKLTDKTMEQLTKQSYLLGRQLKLMDPNSADFKKYSDELSQVKTRMGELSGKSITAKSSISSLADGFNKYAALGTTVVAALTGVVLSVQKIIDINGKLSDAQADVIKTTGLTKIEVDELTKSFGLLQTRTSRIDLLGIAEQGGRIGIAKAEIGDFVKTMNMAAVSLGDSFTGGAEEVANKLGKIKFLFEETKGLNVEQAYNSIGSAINDLGANGVASEANIADFTTRIGSLTDVLKPSIQEVLALGTAFEESGIESEVSARAYGIFMKQASTESGKFAQVMGISQQAVKDMINTNPMEFMLKFSEGMKGMSATDTATTLDALGISADGANKVIGAMGNNTARFRELIDLSNDSFASGTSLINEYTIKNETLGATLEKISKKVSGWFSSETFIKYLGGAVTWFAKFVGAAEDADGSITAWRNTLVFVAKVIAIVTAAMVTNVGWQKLVVLWTNRNTEANLLYSIGAKARAFADGVAMVASQAYAAMTMLLTGNVVGATQAFRVMTATMMTTPWGFILGAVAAVAAAYVIFSENAVEAETAQSMLQQTMRETTSIVNQQTIELKSLLAVAQDETASKEARLAAIKKLKEIAPEYLQTLTLENVKTAEGTKLIDAYVKSLEKKAMLQVLQKRQSAIMEEMDTRKNLSLEEEISWYDKAWASVKNLGDAQGAAVDLVTTAAERKKTALDDLQNKLKLTNKEMETFLKKNPSVIASIETTAAKSNFNVPTGGAGTKTGSSSAKNPNSSPEEINKLKLDSDTKYYEQTLKLSRQLEDDKITAMTDGYNKEMLIESNRYKREIEDYENQKTNAIELAKLDEDIAKAKESKDITKYNALLLIRKGWDDKNKELDTKINQIKEGKLVLHNLKVATIEEKGAKESIQKSKEAFEQAKIDREIAFNEKLVALGTNEKAKVKLRKEFEITELNEQEKFLKELLDKFNIIVAKGNFEKMDMSLLSPEQVADFTAEAKKIGLTLSELIAKKNELSGKQTSNAQDLGISKATTDVFGFTPDNWQAFYDNVSAGKFGVDEMVFAVSALVDMWGKYNTMVTANENKQLKVFEKSSDTKKIKLKKQLDSGVINQSQYEKSVAKIDADLDKKKAALSYKQAKREKMIAISSAISGTAMAVVGALGNKPWTPFNFALAGLVGAMGLLQLGTIMAQPMPGHEQGLYQDYVTREQDGKKFKSSYGGETRSGLVSKTSHFLVAENGPEMVIDAKAWRQMNPEVKDALVRDLRGVKGYEKGLYQPEVTNPRNTTPANAPVTQDNQLLQSVLAVLQDNTDVMKQLKDEGVLAMVSNRDLKSMKNLKEGIKDYDALRNKSKK